MSLRGQGDKAGPSRRSRAAAEAGYAMAALLVALAVMSVMMSVALPVWRHEAQRRKEDELIWRGNQYVRAIRLYQMKTGALPPSVDALVQGRFLRKHYKDPITNDEFDFLGPAASVPGLAPGQGQSVPGRAGQPSPAPARSGLGTPQSSFQPGTSVQPSTSFQPSTSGPAASGGSVPGGLTGVRSKSKDESIKIYQGRTHYNEWTFIFVNQNPGIGGPGRGQRGGPVGPNPPQRGIGPNGQPLPFPPGGFNPPGRGGPGRGPGTPPSFPSGFPPNTGRRGGGL